MAKTWQIAGPLRGPAGKSAFEYAQAGGYTGTEEEFAEELAALFASAPNGSSNQPLTFTGAVNATYDGSKAVSVEIPKGGGGEEIIVDEVVLASGTITAGGESAENIDTGVTLADLKKYKMFFVGATGASNTGLSNLYFRFHTSTSNSGMKAILRINNHRGAWSLYAFLDDAKTVYRSVAGQAGNITLENSLVKKASDGTWTYTDYSVSGNAVTSTNMFVLDSIPDDTHIFVMPSTVYSVDVSWKIVGVLR